MFPLSQLGKLFNLLGNAHTQLSNRMPGIRAISVHTYKLGPTLFSFIFKHLLGLLISIKQTTDTSASFFDSFQ